MKTNIELDEQLVKQGFAITGLKTEKELVNFALAELVKKNTPKDLLELAGEIEFVDGFNTDCMRENPDLSQSSKRRQSGSAKGQIWMSPDFDEPLEDFREYM